MSREIERKFLVASDAWRIAGVDATAVRYQQGYLTTNPGCTVRVRAAGEQGFLTVKGRLEGITRPEFEYDIPLGDAAEMLEAFCHGHIIDKTRYTFQHRKHTWEIDVFHGANEGLTLAEIELSSEEESFETPAWLGAEVTHDKRYFNARLLEHPYTEWSNRS